MGPKNYLDKSIFGTCKNMRFPRGKRTNVLWTKNAQGSSFKVGSILKTHKSRVKTMGCRGFFFYSDVPAKKKQKTSWERNFPKKYLLAPRCFG